MPRLIWSRHALDDVARLHAFLASKNRHAARTAVRAIRSGVKSIERHPEIGRPADDMEPEFREWPIEFGAGGYVVLYHYDGHEAVILAVRGREAGY